MNETLPFVSVIIPTRNRAALLRDCLGSLLSQSYPRDRYEVVVVDDGSSDHTATIVQEMRGTHQLSAIVYTNPSGQGLNAARNQGLRTARGEIVAFVDDDTLAPAEWLKAMGDGAARYPDGDCFGGPVRLQLEGRPPRVCREHRVEGAMDFGDAEKDVKFVGGGNMCLRKTAVAKAGAFNEHLSGTGDETEWQMRLLRCGGRIVLLPEAWLWHRRTAVDLRIFRLIFKEFRRGTEEVRFTRLIGTPLSLVGELRPIPRFLAHFLRRRCAGGLFSASASVGRAWGLVQQRGMAILAPRTTKQSSGTTKQSSDSGDM